MNYSSAKLGVFHLDHTAQPVIRFASRGKENVHPCSPRLQRVAWGAWETPRKAHDDDNIPDALLATAEKTCTGLRPPHRRHSREQQVHPIRPRSGWIAHTVDEYPREK
jgi:hypothetical protein